MRVAKGMAVRSKSGSWNFMACACLPLKTKNCNLASLYQRTADFLFSSLIRACPLQTYEQTKRASLSVMARIAVKEKLKVPPPKNRRKKSALAKDRNHCGGGQYYLCPGLAWAIGPLNGTLGRRTQGPGFGRATCLPGSPI